MNNKKYNYTQEDYEFMNSLSSAVLERSPKKLRIILWFWILTIALLISWAYYAQIDEIVRGDGKVVPFGENKMIQNLEGGIVEAILVKEGDIVKRGQILLKIDNQKSQSDYESTNLKSLELMARVIRLSSESNGKPFFANKFKDNDVSTYIPLEETLYKINKLKLKSEIDGLSEQLKQKQNDYTTAKSSINYLRNEYNLIQQEVKIAGPLVARKIRSKVDFLKLKREANNIRKELAMVRIAIPKTKSLIIEAKNKIQEVKDNFRQIAQEELNKTVAELERINANISTLKDKVKRTDVYSPTNGIIQKVFFNTIGGVIKPGENLIEIVPTDDTLLIETKVKPADIAFIFYKQEAKVKFTAYDYAIYGGLDGNVIKIGADTEIDEDKNSFYTVYIQTNENHLTRENKQLPIIPGMVVNVDILTGKKSVLDYILKPILKAKQYTFTER